MTRQYDTEYDPYDTEDGTRPSRVKKTTATRVLRSVLTKKTTRPQEHEIVDLDVEESVAERLARLLAHQAGASLSWGKLVAWESQNDSPAPLPVC